MTTADQRLTDIEVALSYDRRVIDELSQELFQANQEITRLKGKVERLERALASLLEQAEGLPPSEKPPHY